MKGRRLLIGTTNLDAQRPVVWDMGKIAASRSSASHRAVPQGAARVGGDPCSVSARLRRCRGEWRRSTRKCMSTAGATREVFLLPTQIMAKNVDSTPQR
jgi:hypothetical protein